MMIVHCESICHKILQLKMVKMVNLMCILQQKYKLKQSNSSMFQKGESQCNRNLLQRI